MEEQITELSEDEYVVEPSGAELVEFDPTALTASNFLSDVKIDLFSNYLYSYEKGDEVIVGIDSDGIRHIASDLGIGIDECAYTEEEDYFEVSATSISRDGRKYFAVRRQPKKIFTKGGKSFDDKTALSKAYTGAQKNAMRGLIPDKMIKTLIQKSVEFHKRCSDDVEYVRQNIKQFYENHKEAFSEQGITLNMICTEGRVRNNSKDFELNDWLQLRKDIKQWKENWIIELAT